MYIICLASLFVCEVQPRCHLQYELDCLIAIKGCDSASFTVGDEHWVASIFRSPLNYCQHSSTYLLEYTYAHFCWVHTQEYNCWIITHARMHACTLAHTHIHIQSTCTLTNTRTHTHTTKQSAQLGILFNSFPRCFTSINLIKRIAHRCVHRTTESAQSFTMASFPHGSRSHQVGN